MSSCRSRGVASRIFAFRLLAGDGGAAFCSVTMGAANRNGSSRPVLGSADLGVLNNCQLLEGGRSVDSRKSVSSAGPVCWLGLLWMSSGFVGPSSQGLTVSGSWGLGISTGSGFAVEPSTPIRCSRGRDRERGLGVEKGGSPGAETGGSVSSSDAVCCSGLRGVPTGGRSLSRSSLDSRGFPAGSGDPLSLSTTFRLLGVLGVLGVLSKEVAAWGHTGGRDTGVTEQF